MRPLLALLCLVTLNACAKDPVQEAFDRCVTRVREAAKSVAGAAPLTDQHKIEFEMTLKQNIAGACEIIKSTCAADRKGLACTALLQSAGVKP